MNDSKVQMFGATIDAIDMATAVDRVQDWIATDTSSGCKYVVTPNVDHAVMLQTRADLQSVYDDADMVLADGWPIVAASRLLRRPVPERVPGSDLVPCLFKHVDKQHPLRVYLLGAAEGVGEIAAKNIGIQWPEVEVVGVYSPPMGFQDDPAENQAILDRIAAVTPDLLVVGLGAPKQELWVHAHREQLEAKVALCVGATIDFLAGEKSRAPRWVQRIGMEWLHRMCSEPKRLGKRYLKDAIIFPLLCLREFFFGSQRSPS